MADTAQISSLYDPFSQEELKGDDTDLAAEDRPIQTFRNKGTVLISILVVTIAIMITLTIYLGFFYEKGFRKEQISKTSDLIGAGKTAAEAEATRAEQIEALKNSMTNELETAGYVIGALAIIAALIFFGMIWYWRGVARPELTRENIIGRDLSYAMKTGTSLDNVSRLLAYHVHPDDQTSQDSLSKNLSRNIRYAMDKEIMFPSKVARRLRGAAPVPPPLPTN